MEGFVHALGSKLPPELNAEIRARALAMIADMRLAAGTNIASQ